jgi:hypothetical protein
MLIKKLAVPLINEKILQQAEHCYIATAAVTEAGFDMVKSRLQPKCKIEMVTGLDELTAPAVLRRVWRHYQDKISFHIYTRNTFHANVYIFDLPFRKSVAFVGSGQFSLEGLKDHEEVFYKITDAKEIEALKSWFVGYFEFAEPISENLIQKYEVIYPGMLQRAIQSRKEKQIFTALTAGNFSWDNLRLKNHFFKKEDYETFAIIQTAADSDAVCAERNAVKVKLTSLHDALKRHASSLRLAPPSDPKKVVSSIYANEHADGKVYSMWLSFGRSEAEMKKYDTPESQTDFFNVQVIITQKDVVMALVSMTGSGRVDREFLKQQMFDVDFKGKFFTLLTGLGSGYWIEVAGDRRPVEFFQKDDALGEFIKNDDWRYYDLSIGRTFIPEAPEISTEHIAATAMKVFDCLVPVYTLLKDKKTD